MHYMLQKSQNRRRYPCDSFQEVGSHNFMKDNNNNKRALDHKSHLHIKTCTSVIINICKIQEDTAKIRICLILTACLATVPIQQSSTRQKHKPLLTCSHNGGRKSLGPITSYRQRREGQSLRGARQKSCHKCC